MTIIAENISTLLERGEQARLIPVVADTSREQRVTSALLATFMLVEDFGKGMLRMIDAPASKSAKITCLTEVVFKGGENGSKLRPDGLIVVTTGGRQWCAIVEAKVGGVALSPEQIESYLATAKICNLDAVITISNQYVSNPTHYPIHIDPRKTKTVRLFHWSWMSVLAEAILHAEHKGISDPEQAFILRELIRYLQHPSSGVVAFSQMDSGWKDVCMAVQNATPILRHQPSVVQAVNSWHQLARYLSLQLSVAVGRTVSVHMSRAQTENPNLWAQDAITGLVEAHQLEAEFDVPDAASRIKLVADLNRRNLMVSMRLRAPTDKSIPRATVTWLLKQLGKCLDNSAIIRAKWPGRSPDTGATLEQLRLDPRAILTNNPKQMPVSFEIAQVTDLAGRFKGSRTFVEAAETIMPKFYSEVGQYLKAWVPAPPKITGPVAEDSLAVDDGAIAGTDKVSIDIPPNGPEAPRPFDKSTFGQQSEIGESQTSATAHAADSGTT